MKVVLLQNIRGVGRMGETKDVSDGYAKNFLLPRKLAQPAHKTVVAQVKNLEKRAALEAAKESAMAKEILEAVTSDDFELEVTGKANKGGGLYAAITEKDISKALKNKGLKVAADVIKIKDPIKSIGDHQIQLDFGDELKASLQLRVQP